MATFHSSDSSSAIALSPESVIGSSSTEIDSTSETAGSSIGAEPEAEPKSVPAEADSSSSVTGSSDRS